MTPVKKVEESDPPPVYPQPSIFGTTSSRLWTSLIGVTTLTPLPGKDTSGFSSKTLTIRLIHLCKNFFFDNVKNICNSHAYFEAERKPNRHYLAEFHERLLYLQFLYYRATN